MKFTIETSALASALNVASVAVDNRITLPILGNVKLEATESELILSTTNLDLYVIQRLSAKVGKTGATTVPFSIFQRLVNRLSPTQTAIETNNASNKAIRVSSGEVEAVIETLTADEFPPPLEQNRENAVVCDAKEILTPFAKVAHAISQESSRYVLQGINIAPQNGHNTFVATTGKVMGIFVGPAVSRESVIIPDGFVRAVLKIKPAGVLSVAISDGLISLSSPALDINGRLIEGVYPQWQNAVPKNGNKLFGCDRKELIEALRTCALFSDKETRALEMSGKGKEIQIAKDDNIKALVLGSELAGQPSLTMRFGADYMLDTLNVLEGSNVTIRCSEAGKAMVIEEGPFKGVIGVMQAKQ